MGGFLKPVTAILGLQMFYPELKRLAIELQVYCDWSSDIFTETNTFRGHGGPMILDSQPELVMDRLVTLRGLRTAGLPVNASIAHNIILGFNAQQCPTLLDSMPHRDNAPVSSIWITCWFPQYQLNWVVCSGTKAAQKLSFSWISDCEKTFFRLSFTVLNENIHPSMVVSADQTGVILVPGGTQQAYEEQGVKQVLIHEKEEKQAFTAVLATYLDGTVLLSQSVWMGKTEQSLPSQNLNYSQRNIHKSEGHCFVLNPRKHWSSRQTTNSWFISIIEPYWQRMITTYALSSNAKMIVYLDCWSVHHGKELAIWLKSTYTWLILIFLPVNCTSKIPRLGALIVLKSISFKIDLASIQSISLQANLLTGVFQPCDVGLQRVFKHIIRQKASEFFIGEVWDQLASGVSASEIKTSATLAPLRNQTICWVRTAVDYLNSQPALVHKAWKNCTTGMTLGSGGMALNLSYESLSKLSNLGLFMGKSKE